MPGSDWLRLRRIVAGLCLVPLLTACTSSGESGRPSAAAPSAPALSSAPGAASPLPGLADASVLVCRSVNGAQPAPPPDREVVLGDLALPTGWVLQTRPSGKADPPARLYAKEGLVARAGAVVDVRVAPGWEGRARIAWGQEPLTPSLGVHVPACPQPCHYSSCTSSGLAAQWLGFVGGYFVDQPTCLPLIVDAGGRQARVYISVGVPCAGQTGAPAVGSQAAAAVSAGRS